MIRALNAIFDIIKSILGLIGDLFSFVFKFAKSIPNLLSYITNGFSFLPSVLIAIFGVAAIVILVKGLRKYL